MAGKRKTIKLINTILHEDELQAAQVKKTGRNCYSVRISQKTCCRWSQVRSAEQPHNFDIATGLALQTPAEFPGVELAADVGLEQNYRMISGPTGRLRIDA